MGTPITGIKLASPNKMEKVKHVVRGTIHAAHTHHTGGHITLEVKHGKRPKLKGKKNDLQYDDRPSTSFVIPKHVAKHYPIGAAVHIGITPAKDADTLGEDDSEDEGFKSLKK